MKVRVDHIAIAVRDFEKSANSIYKLHGLQGYRGGRIAGLGVENFLIPLGDGYIELISIADEREAASNPLGRAVIEKTKEREALLLFWAVNSEGNLHEISDRLGVSVSHIKRSLPDGGDLAYQLAGLQKAIDEPNFPFFIEWENRDHRPDQTFTDHKVEPLGFAYIEVGGDKESLQKWLGDLYQSLPLEHTEGDTRLHAFSIVTETGNPITFREPLTFNTEAEQLSATIEESSEPSQIMAKEETHPKFEGESEKVESEEQEKSGPSVFESVLDQVEQALESAATIVENAAGEYLSPSKANRKT